MLTEEILKNVTPDTKLGICIYTDGGGKIHLDRIKKEQVYTGGLGVHGYLFIDEEVSKTGSGLKGYLLTDKGYVTLGDEKKPVKVLNYFNPKDSMTEMKTSLDITPIAYFNIRQGLDNATNNVAEAVALLEALLLIEGLKQTIKLDKISFIMDSQYVIKTFLNLDAYAIKNWIKSDGKPLANLDIWKQIHKVAQRVITTNVPVTIEWTKGHKDNHGNIMADRLASQGLTAGLNGYFEKDVLIKPAKGFWSKKKVDIHPFFVECKWYYTPKPEYGYIDNKPTLYLGTHSEDERFCQPSSEDLFGVVLLNEIPDELKTVQQFSECLSTLETGFDFDGIHYTDFGVLYNPEVLALIQENNPSFFKRDMQNRTISTVDGKSLITKFGVVGLSRLGYGEYFLSLEKKLERVIQNKLLNTDTLVDITDMVFQTVEKKKKTEVKVIVGNDPFIPVEADYCIGLTDTGERITERCSLSVTFGITAPKRRLLNSVKELNPKVYVLTTLLERKIIQYSTVVVLDNGEASIWSNLHASIRIFP